MTVGGKQHDLVQAHAENRMDFRALTQVAIAVAVPGQAVSGHGLIADIDGTPGQAYRLPFKVSSLRLRRRDKGTGRPGCHAERGRYDTGPAETVAGHDLNPSLAAGGQDGDGCSVYAAADETESAAGLVFVPAEFCRAHHIQRHRRRGSADADPSG